MQLILDSDIKTYLKTSEPFDELMSLRGEIYRELEGRRTQKITLGGKNYFIKQHTGVGWKEIFKNLLQFRLPVFSASNEWCAVNRLHELGIPTMDVVGYGCRGINPARLHSFLITRELPKHTSLEDFCKNWEKEPPDFRLKQTIIKKVAHIAREIHTNGINHRDFYLCHFLLEILDDKNNFTLYLIDLHRAAIRRRTPLRWIIKDLAGLYFSSKNSGLTKRDLLRFMKEYRNNSLSELITDRSFWLKVKKRGDELYRKLM